MDVYDFPVVMTVVGFLNLAVAILLFAYQTYQHFRTKIQDSSALSISSGDDCGNPVEAGKKKIKKVAFLSSFDEQDERQTLLNDQEEICYGSSSTTKWRPLPEDVLQNSFRDFPAVIFFCPFSQFFVKEFF